MAETVITGIVTIGGAIIGGIAALLGVDRIRNRNGTSHQDPALTKSLVDVAAGLMKMADKLDADILESKLSRQAMEGSFGMIIGKLSTIRSGEMAQADTERIIAKIDSMKGQK